MMTRIPGQFEGKLNPAAIRDIVLRWSEGIGAAAVGARYGLSTDEVMGIVDSQDGKAIREELRKRSIDYTLERFDATAPQNLEKLVALRDGSEDEKMQRQAAIDLLEYSSLKKTGNMDGNMGAEIFRGIAKLAKEVAEEKKPEAVEK